MPKERPEACHEVGPEGVRILFVSARFAANGLLVDHGVPQHSLRGSSARSPACENAPAISLEYSFDAGFKCNIRLKTLAEAPSGGDVGSDGFAVHGGGEAGPRHFTVCDSQNEAMTCPS